MGGKVYLGLKLGMCGWIEVFVEMRKSLSGLCILRINVDIEVMLKNVGIKEVGDIVGDVVEGVKERSYV